MLENKSQIQLSLGQGQSLLTELWGLSLGTSACADCSEVSHWKEKKPASLSLTSSSCCHSYEGTAVTSSVSFLRELAQEGPSLTWMWMVSCQRITGCSHCPKSLAPEETVICCHPRGETRPRGSVLGSDLGSSRGLSPLVSPTALPWPSLPLQCRWPTQMLHGYSSLDRPLLLLSPWIHAPNIWFNKYLLSAWKVSGTLPGSEGKPTLEVLTF